MWQRFTFEDMRTITHYLGVLVSFAAAVLVLPFVVALIWQDYSVAARYLRSMGVCLVAGNIMRFAQVQPRSLTRRQAMAVTGLAWVVLAFFFALPLFMSGHYARFLDSYFDCVSGLTTTGASVILDLDHLSVADNMMRFSTHYVGGMGLIVIALSLGLFGRRVRSSLYNAEGRSDHVVPNIVQTTRFIAIVSTSIITVATLSLMFVLLYKGMGGINAFLHGLWLAVSAFMTGGFSPGSTSVVMYHSLGLNITLMIVMLMGGVNFTLYREAWRGRVIQFFKDIEVHTMIIWVLIMTVALTISLGNTKHFSGLPEIMQHGVFMVISAATTSGFQTITSNQLTTVFSNGALLVITMLMLVGAGSGSTAGGIKFFRVGIIAKGIKATIKETLASDTARVSVDYYHLGRRVVDAETVKEAMTVFSLMMIVFALGALFGVAHGYDAMSSIFEAASMAGNAGLSSGIISAGMPPELEIVYILAMWAGRLEFVTLMALMVEFFVSINPEALLTKLSQNRGASHLPKRRRAFWMR